MPTIVMRVAEASDVAAILDLYQAAGIGSDEAFSTDEGIAMLASFGQYPFYKVYVATLGDAVVGTYELLIVGNLAKRGAKSAVIEDVAVSPAHQGKGIGRAMMAHAKEVATAEGAYKLALSSNLKRTSAHAFYAALGFEQHGLSFVTSG